MIRLGIDRIGEFTESFKGRRIGLITNGSGYSSRFVEDAAEFTSLGFDVKKIFTPEHGLYGAMDGETVENGRHPHFDIPIISLYHAGGGGTGAAGVAGEDGAAQGPQAQDQGRTAHEPALRNAPDLKDLDDTDILVYDIQDVGLRYYTYIYTLEACMIAADRAGIPFIVLDRPNPLGDKVSGGVMGKRFESFVGGLELPVRYGLTPGELGYYIKDYLNLSLDYSVVPMDGYEDPMLWPDTGMPFNYPSPSIHSFEALLCYNGGCFFEATNISEGRGTCAPFKIIGAPFVDMKELTDRLREEIAYTDLAVRPRAFTPFWSKFSGQTCFGVEFIPLSNSLDFSLHALKAMRVIRDLYPEQFGFVRYADVARLSSLTGDEESLLYVEGKLEYAALKDKWTSEAASFAKKAEQYRMYA